VLADEVVRKARHAPRLFAKARDFAGNPFTKGESGGFPVDQLGGHHMP
jgi:hypothetical protein